jgi:hypothetical protein
MLKFWMAVGVIFWIWMAVWLVRLGLGLEHLSKDEIVPGIIGGIGGGWAAWYFVPRLLRKEAERSK